MSIADPVTSPSSANTWINGLKWGQHWDTPGAGPTVIYYMTAPAGTVNFGGTNVTAFDMFSQELAAINSVLAGLEAIINVDFVATTNVAQADIVLASVNDFDAEGNLGVAVPPGEYYNASIADWQSAVIVNRDIYEYAAGLPTALGVGGYDYVTWLHEIGHALGLAHPHDDGGTSTIFPGVTAEFDDYGDHDMNQGIYTTMSYNDGFVAGANAPGPSATFDFGWQATMMGLDVAALQLLYGANPNFASGNDTYVLVDVDAIGTGYRCIWDTGGSDTISYSGSAAAIMDLRAASLGLATGGGGFVSKVTSVDTRSGFTIASGVVIENATGGSGDDTLIGNAANNQLNGGGGNDTLLGNAGADMLDGGAGNDTMTGGGDNDTYTVDSSGDIITELSSQGYDTVNTTLTSFTLGANIERVNFTGVGNFAGAGNSLDNRFQSGAGDDRFVDTFGGADIFSGGNGTDVVDFRLSATGAIINLATSVHGGAASGDSYSGIERFWGSNTAADTMTGDSAKNSFYGFGGNDTLTGGSHSDRLEGGAGGDTLQGGLDKDILNGGANNDILTGGDAADSFEYSAVAFGQDTVTDFVDSVDKLKVFTGVADDVSDFTIVGNGTTSVVLTLMAATANAITLNGATPITITNADFVFY